MMICPNGCTDIETDAPLEMEFAFSELHDNKPGYMCPDCGDFELQRDRGRL